MSNKTYGIKKFTAVEFTTAIGCKLDCVYCPQKLFVGRYVELYGTTDTVLSFESFKKILKKVQKGGGVSFSGMVEPFTNPMCAQMIRYAYDNGYKVSLFTTLMGMKMEDLDMISSVNFSAVTLHIPDQEGNSRFVLDEQYFEILKSFIKRISIDYYSCHGTIHPTVEKYINQEKFVASQMANRAGNLQREDVTSVDRRGQKRLVCASGTAMKSYGHTPVILPNGIVVLCCMDYGLRHILGNVLTQDVDEIMSGHEMCSVLNSMYEGTPEVLCHTCSSAFCKEKYTRLFSIDAVRVGKLIYDYVNNDISEEQLNTIVGVRSAEIVKLLATKKNVCVYGLGRLFQENYFDSRWCDIIQANLFVDSNEEKWNKEIKGIICKAPDELSEIEDLLVVTYVQDDTEIRSKLSNLNADIINVYDIYNIFN